MQLSQIKQMADKTAIAEPITVTVSDIGEQKTNVGQWKKSYQSAKFTQGGEFVYGTFENQPDLKPMEGLELVITPGQDKEGNPTGIYASDHTAKNGNTYKNLRITKSAKITTTPGAGQPLGEEKPSNQSAPTTANRPPAPSVNPKVELNKMANLLCFCYGAVHYTRDTVKEKHGIEISDEAFEQKVTSMFIQANNKGITQYMKAGTLTAPNDPPTPAPEPEPSEEDSDEPAF